MTESDNRFCVNISPSSSFTSSRLFCVDSIDEFCSTRNSCVTANLFNECEGQKGKVRRGREVVVIYWNSFISGPKIVSTSNDCTNKCKNAHETHSIVTPGCSTLMRGSPAHDFRFKYLPAINVWLVFRLITIRHYYRSAFANGRHGTAERRQRPCECVCVCLCYVATKWSHFHSPSTSLSYNVSFFCQRIWASAL